MLIGRDAFANTFKSASFNSLCPYNGMYFDGLLITQAALDQYLSNYNLAELSGLCHPWNTVSKEYIDSLNYGKDFSFYEGIDSTYANRRFSWSIKNKTIYNAHISSLPTGTKSITIAQDDTDHTAREMYVDLSSDVTIAATSLFATGAAVDWYLNGELSTFKDEFFKAGTHFVWHFMEYQPNHFMVEKVGGVEADLSAKADLSAIPTKTSQLSNDSDYITLAQVPTPSYIEDATGNRINANLSCIYIDDTAWEVTDPSSNKHILEYVGFIQSYHTWECVEPENIKLVLTYANDWELQVYTWQEVGPGGDYDWVLDINGSYDGDSDITTIPYFVNAQTTYNYSAQRPVTKHLTLATKEYVDSRLSALEARIAALEGN